MLLQILVLTHDSTRQNMPEDRIQNNMSILFKPVRCIRIDNTTLWRYPYIKSITVPYKPQEEILTVSVSTYYFYRAVRVYRGADKSLA